MSNITTTTAYSWPDPIETIYQTLGSDGKFARKIPHLDLPTALFIGAVMNTPRDRRPWGIVTWMGEMFNISRPTLYSLGERVLEQFQIQPETEPAVPEKSILVTETRLKRTILSHSIPGNMSIRDSQVSLQEAFDQRPSIGTISQLITSAGQKAGQVLSNLSYKNLGIAIVLRDETFFQGKPILIMVEPISTTILFAEVCPDRKSDTWGLALLMVEEKGVTIKGLVEDMAQAFPKSQQLAELEDTEVQKDTWHVQRDAGNLAKSLLNTAYKAIGEVYELDDKLLKCWNDELFEQKYIPAVEKQDLAIEQYDSYIEWSAHLHDAFELVDRRSGEIRDRQINGWLLEETLSALEKIDHPKVKKLVNKIRNHQDQMLTFLDWAQTALEQFKIETEGLIPDGFIRMVARCWWYRQALINGHNQFKSAAEVAEMEFRVCLDGEPLWTQFADQLLSILSAATRASSLVEGINSLLKSFLDNRCSFHSTDTLQAYINLFVLWHNMRVYSRGKREGKSPFQLAGIETPSDDWLELLGYPAN